MGFKDQIDFPRTFKYSSDSEHIPLEFYENVFPLSKRIDLLLGYFSSNAFTVLAESFAEFIYNDPESKMRIITNHHLSALDKENLIENTELQAEDKVIDLFQDIESLRNQLNEKGQHFFDCLKYLLKEGRLIIKPVKFNQVDLAHCKRMIFYDGKDHIATDGSINFTYNAMIKNAESFSVDVPWKGEVFQDRVEEEIRTFESIINEEHPDYKYIDANEVEGIVSAVGRDRDIEDLVEESYEITSSSRLGKKVKKIREAKVNRFAKLVEVIRSKPHFPKFDGKISKPRKYQQEAYENWVESSSQGIFAMATGTGKTITSLNCVLELYKQTNTYKVLILVPTAVLVEQWIGECEKFNFSNIYTSYDKDWINIFSKKKLDQRLGLSSNFIFISTYANYNSKKFQSIFSDFNDPNLILIADEAHNLGTARSVSNYLWNIQKRIGLSATPNRKYDEVGTADIEKYFNSYAPNHTISYTMLEAIENKFLTPYIYYPYFVKLSEDEMAAYADVTKKLLKFFDFEKGTYKDEATNLLIKRKRIIHQASEKKKVLLDIIDKIKEEDDDFKHCIVYVPEGYEPDYSQVDNEVLDEEDEHIIDGYTKALREKGLRPHQVVGGMLSRNRILNQFEEGMIQVLTAMKTLDEGVDIPATKYAIFCASSGNPRQYVQRRGRILRKFEGKEHAYVFDIVIEPQSSIFWENLPQDKREGIQKMEKNIFKSELFRIANFLYAAANISELHTGTDDRLNRLVELCEKYELDLFEMINELRENDKNNGNTTREN